MTDRVIHEPRFECTACGQCCTGDPATHYVEVSATEQERIYRKLGLSARQFRRQYLETAEDGSEGVRLVGDGVCPFLLPDKRCSIYRVRPDQCRTYPFWPELVFSETSWAEEKCRCEGIGRGPVIPENDIRERLSAHKKYTGHED